MKNNLTIDCGIERIELTDKANSTFEKTYKMLSGQFKPRKNHRVLKRTAASVGTLAASFALLLSLNLAFPAFAENIPGIGGIFKTMNSYSKHPTGSNIPTYQGMETINIAATATGNEGYGVEIAEAYSDGKMLHFALKLTTPVGDAEKYTYFFIKDPTIEINGQSCSFNSFVPFFPDDGGVFHTVGSVILPQEIENGSKLSVNLGLPNLWALDNKFSSQSDEAKVDIGTAFTAQFEAKVDTSNNQFIELKSDTDNGIELISLEATPSYTKILSTVPYTAQEGEEESDELKFAGSITPPALYTLDGTEVPLASISSFDSSNPPEETHPIYFDGLPMGTKEVVLRYFGNTNCTEVYAEFIVNLAEKTARASTTYKEGGALDINSPNNYKNITNADTVYENGELVEKNYTNNYKLGTVGYYRYGDNEFICKIMTPEEYREIKVEIYSADGTLLGSTVSQNGTLYENENWFYDENSPFWANRADMYGADHTYKLEFSSIDGNEPGWMDTITVKVTDNTTGEEILTEDVTLTFRQTT